MREKAFRVYATVRECEKTLENAFASMLRRQSKNKRKKSAKNCSTKCVKQ